MSNALPARHGIVLGLGSLALMSALFDVISAPAPGEALRTSFLIGAFLVSLATMPIAAEKSGTTPRGARSLGVTAMSIALITALIALMIRGDARSWWVVGLVLVATVLLKKEPSSLAS